MMSEDGLLFKFMGDVDKETGVCTYTLSYIVHSTSNIVLYALNIAYYKSTIVHFVNLMTHRVIFHLITLWYFMV